MTCTVDRVLLTHLRPESPELRTHQRSMAPTRDGPPRPVPTLSRSISAPLKGGENLPPSMRLHLQVSVGVGALKHLLLLPLLPEPRPSCRPGLTQALCSGGQGTLQLLFGTRPRCPRPAELKSFGKEGGHACPAAGFQGGREPGRRASCSRVGAAGTSGPSFLVLGRPCAQTFCPVDG